MGRQGQDLTLVCLLTHAVATLRIVRLIRMFRLITLNALKASDEITDEQSRQVSYLDRNANSLGVVLVLLLYLHI